MTDRDIDLQDHVLFDTPDTLLAVVEVAAQRGLTQLVFAEPTTRMRSYDKVFERAREHGIRILVVEPPFFERKPYP